jgi:hypothetical protein
VRDFSGVIRRGATRLSEAHGSILVRLTIFEALISSDGDLHHAVRQIGESFQQLTAVSCRGVMRQLAWLVLSNAEPVDSHTFIWSRRPFQQRIWRILQVLIEKRARERFRNLKV